MKVLGRWATVGFAVLAVVLSAEVAILAMRFIVPATQNLDLHGRISNGARIAVGSLVSTPVLIITLVLASRRSGSSVLAYLGIDVPRWRHVAIAVAALGGWVALIHLAHGLDISSWTVEIYRSAGAAGSLLWLWLAVVVAGPIREELLYRGFMFRGFVRAPRDLIPGTMLISLLWSLEHFQYGWLGMGEIFVVGVLLGLARWRTGSTTLTILLHAIEPGTIDRGAAHVELDLIKRECISSPGQRHLR